MGLVTLLKTNENIILSGHVTINNIHRLLSNKSQINECGHSAVSGHHEQKNPLGMKYNYLYIKSFPCNINRSTAADGLYKGLLYAFYGLNTFS